jgi:bifunctional non-homologous end joining protein LigD
MGGTAHKRLSKYREKRRFDVTPEPSGAKPKRAPGHSFVVQKHAARRLHYDFRLELDGVLLSWAVPKGPSLVAGEKRLAARTEDHPIDYADFEGIIPAGQYGGGTVVVWDRGTWEPEGDPRAGLDKGRLSFTLHGEKLRGRWHLVETKQSWLLFKSKDDEATGVDITATRPESVITGRTVDEVAKDADRVWHSNRTPVAELVAQLPSDVPLTNLDKVLWPEMGLTKAQLIAYLAVVADHMLPIAGGRPLMVLRCPNGHQKHCFHQKNDLPVLEDVKDLVTLAQLGALEIHTWGAHAADLEHPDQLVFDLDPDTTVGFPEVVATALALRTRLQALGLETFVKTTGGKGLHVVAPIAPKVSWPEFLDFSRAVVEQMAADEPKRYTTNPLKAARRGKIFLDYLRNARGATAVAAYSPRARPGAPVSTPLDWAEIELPIDPASFDVTTVPKRLGARRAAPWADYASVKQSLRVSRGAKARSAAPGRRRSR